MAIRADIKVTDEWRRYENKTIRITCFQSDGVTAYDLSVISVGDLQWKLLRHVGSATAYIEKSNAVGGGIMISGAGSNVAEIEIVGDTDYDDVPAGVHAHELWDRDNDLLLSYGDAWLLHAAAEPVP